MTPRAPRPPTRRNLILRAQRLRRLHAELAALAEQAQLTPAETNIIEHASKALYQVEFILTTSARRAQGATRPPAKPSAKPSAGPSAKPSAGE